MSAAICCDVCAVTVALDGVQQPDGRLAGVTPAEWATVTVAGEAQHLCPACVADFLMWRHTRTGPAAEPSKRTVAKRAVKKPAAKVAVP